MNEDKANNYMQEKQPSDILFMAIDSMEMVCQKIY